jgi:beta-xylosidase
MKRHRTAVITLALMLVWLTGCPSGNSDFLPPDGTTLFFDEFDGGELAAGWVFDHPDGSKFTLSARPGFARLYAEASTGDDAPLSVLLRELEGDFVVTTRMEFDPDADRHIAGVAIEDENERRLSFGLLRASGPRGTFRGVVPIAEEDAELDIDRDALSFDGSAIYLRVERILDQFELAYSTDGETYTRVGTVTTNLTDMVRVGVGTAASEDCNTSCEEIDPADFDFFKISAAE